MYPCGLLIHAIVLSMADCARTEDIHKILPSYCEFVSGFALLVVCCFDQIFLLNLLYSLPDVGAFTVFTISSMICPLGVPLELQ